MVYKPFSKFVLRTPVLSFSFYERLTQGTSVEISDLKETFADPIIKEAIYLASPSLYHEIEKWILHGLKNPSQEEKLRYALLKYISRMCSRCTPFGLFAGTTIGTFGHETRLELSSNKNFKRHTRLDMNYLVALSQDLNKDPHIRNQLVFFPNSSIYEAGDQLRYVEYRYVNTQRTHQIVAVENSIYLENILKAATSGARPLELARAIVDEDIPIEDAQEYVDQLITSQLLISELEPSVAGPEFIHQILKTLERLDNVKHISSTLQHVQQSISQLDKILGNDVNSYTRIGDMLQQLPTKFDPKFLFQTDVQVTTHHNSIGPGFLQKVKKAMRFFNRISRSQASTSMASFQSAFYNRYGDKEVSLAKALDVELGIGFIQGQDSGDFSPLLEGIDLGQTVSSDILDLKWSGFSSILRSRLTTCLKNNESLIQLTDDDFESIQDHWDDLPDTMSCISELITLEGEEKVVLSGISGPNGAKLLGRFCHGDGEVLNHTQEILEVERKISGDKILAEIVHLPEARVGNILMRPKLRPYEIPYLAKSLVASEKQIDIEDLYIHTRPGQPVRLRSKKLNKEVIPCLTVAHNHNNSGLPIYQFLASVRSQSIRPTIGFSWPATFNEYEHLPRVEYHDVIISPAIWNISTKGVKVLIALMSDKIAFDEKTQDFLAEKKLPKYVTLVDGDNELLINTHNFSSIKMLFDTVHKRDSFQLKEFLHTGSPINQQKGIHANQIIISFYNQTKLDQSTARHD